MAKGDVTYELRADDSKLESDINEANKKVEKAVKNKGLERSLKVRIPQEVYDELKKEMADYEK